MYKESPQDVAQGHYTEVMSLYEYERLMASEKKHLFSNLWGTTGVFAVLAVCTRATVVRRRPCKVCSIWMCVDQQIFTKGMMGYVPWIGSFVM